MGKSLSLVYSIQTESEAHPASYSGVPRALSTGVNLQEPEANNSSPSSVEAKKCGAIFLLHHIS